jgi:hypothetical protein
MLKILPVLLLFVGTGIGVGAAMFMPAGSNGPDTPANASAQNATSAEAGAGQVEFVKMNNQFVVPIVEKGRVTALVVMSLSLETASGMKEEVLNLEPKLRDAFLQVMFDHANMGGFSGAFTEAEPLRILRNALRDAARKELGDSVSNVLIVDIARQDV